MYRIENNKKNKGIMIKKILNFLESNLYVRVVIIIMIVITSFGIWNKHLKKEKIPSIETNYVFDDSFDMKKVPSGTVIWVHGVPNYECDFKFMNPDNRYKYFDIGIWNIGRGIVYKIRIPFYAKGMFPLGKIINPKLFNKKRNPNNDNYVYPNENIKII